MHASSVITLSTLFSIKESLCTKNVCYFYLVLRIMSLSKYTMGKPNPHPFSWIQIKWAALNVSPWFTFHNPYLSIKGIKLFISIVFQLATKMSMQFSLLNVFAFALLRKLFLLQHITGKVEFIKPCTSQKII